MLTLVLVIVACCVLQINAHGSLYDPPARSSAWRFDSTFPPYYNDMEMFCGGIKVQWQNNGGMCGICGEPYHVNPKAFEKGGSMYTGRIVKTYKKGQTIDVHVDLPSNHQGWFEFKICNVDGWTTEATQSCLDKTVLEDIDGINRFPITGWESVDFRRKLVLPSSLTCDHCVFQWKYHAGNNWGTDPVTGQSCIGCDPVQEEFYGCADVRISIH